jgi:hypothetical protein
MWFEKPSMGWKTRIVFAFLALGISAVFAQTPQDNTTTAAGDPPSACEQIHEHRSPHMLKVTMGEGFADVTLIPCGIALTDDHAIEAHKSPDIFDKIRVHHTATIAIYGDSVKVSFDGQGTLTYAPFDTREQDRSSDPTVTFNGKGRFDVSFSEGVGESRKDWSDTDQFTGLQHNWLNLWDSATYSVWNWTRVYAHDTAHVQAYNVFRISATDTSNVDATTCWTATAWDHATITASCPHLHRLSKDATINNTGTGYYDEYQ